MFAAVRAKLSREDGSNLAHSFQLLLILAAARVTLFLVFMLLLRKMGTAQFGTFFLGYNTLAFVPLIADMGIGQTFVRHISFYRTSRPDFSAYLHWLFFLLKIASVAILIGVSIPALPLIVRFLNLHREPHLLMLAVMGSGAVILSEYVGAVFQSQCLFRRYELYLFLRNTLFLAAAIVMTWFLRAYLTPTFLILALVLVHLGLVVSAAPYLARLWHEKSGEFSEFRSSLFRYSGWLTVAAICFALYRRMDVYLLSHFRTVHEVGIYSVAVVLVEPVAMISPALVTVFLPRLSAEPTPDRLRRHTYLVASICGIVLFGSFLYLGVLRLIFPYLGSQYREALPLVGVLLMSTVLLIAYNVLSLAFLALDRPDVFGQIALVMAIGSLAANWFLIPPYGVLAAGTVYGLTQLFGVVLATFFVHRLLRESKPALQIEPTPLQSSESILS